MTPSAVDMLKQPIRSDSGTSDDLGDVTLSELTLDGAKLDADIAGRITGAQLVRTIEGASTLTLTVRDHDDAVKTSGILEQDPLDCQIDGAWYRLVNTTKNDDDLTIIFEDREVAILRTKKGNKKAPRAKSTRAQFARSLVREVKNPVIVFYCPEINKVQPIGPAKPSKAAANDKREPGFAPNAKITVKGKKANKTQVDLLGRILAVGVSLKASKKALLAAIMACTQESVVSTHPAGEHPSHIGLFQMDKDKGTEAQRRNPEYAARFFFNTAKPVYKNNPKISEADLAEAVERSGRGELYARHKSEATKTLEQYNGAASTMKIVTPLPYYFMRGAPAGDVNENSWDCLGRLATEVAWRRFMVKGKLYFISEDQLFKSRPRLVLSEDSPGVSRINWSYDTRKAVDKATVTCRASLWTAPPGSVVVVEGQGAKADGRWLISEISRSLFSREATISLVKPTKAKNEPAPESKSETVTGGSQSENNKRTKILEAAQRALKERGRYTYVQVRPIPKSLFSGSIDGPDLRIDCSAFATLCYRSAGAKDPNGFGYDGNGNTGTMVSRGKKTSKPQVGDICMYGGTAGYPQHCTVYIGNGQCIGMGLSGITKLNAKSAIGGAFRGFWTFDV